MRAVDADKLRNRFRDPESQLIVDTEPTILINEADNNIQWLTAARERKLKTVHAISYGVECSRCRRFQIVKTRFCGDCGGYFDGELDIVNKYAERKIKENFQWHE